VRDPVAGDNPSSSGKKITPAVEKGASKEMKKVTTE